MTIPELCTLFEIEQSTVEACIDQVMAMYTLTPYPQASHSFPSEQSICQLYDPLMPYATSQPGLVGILHGFVDQS
jgi:hypothetical protein